MPYKTNPQGVLVHKIACVGEWVDLEIPTLSSKIQCYTCGCKDHYTPGVSCQKDTEKVWMCANPLCLTMALESVPEATTIPVERQRALGMALFAEINGLGNKTCDITFEKIEQSKEKIDYMRRFVANPNGMILMQGDRGGGKTYASLGMCELFMRKDASCRFVKTRDLFDRWQRWTRQEGFDDLLSRLVNVTLLVIDDFGVAEPSPAFMMFFLQLLDKRFDWNNRGTVITTNLDDLNLNRICGETLMDRLKCAQKFTFKEGSRRSFKPL